MAVKLMAAPETKLKGAGAQAVRLRVPPPLFCTVRVSSLLLPTLTPPKFTVVGLTVSTGPWVPVPRRVRVGVPPLELRLTLPCAGPTLLGVKRRVRV